MLGRFIRMLGAAMVLVGLGLVALFFVGPPGGLARKVKVKLGSHYQAVLCGDRCASTAFVAADTLQDAFRGSPVPRS